jgi:hypothetical protein
VNLLDMLGGAGNIPPDLSFEWRGAEVVLIDFEIIKPYVITVQTIIVVFIYIRFFWYLVKKAPSVLRGS